MQQARAAAFMIVALLLAGCQSIERHTSRHDGMPRDVASFLDRRSACGDYSEDPFADDTRDDFMADQSALYCSGTDRELKRLRAKYTGNTQVNAALDALEHDLQQR